MTALRGAQARRLVETFRREGRVEVRFSRGMVGLYLALGAALLACGLVLIGIAMGVVSPGTGTAEGSAVPGAVFALVGLFILGLGIGQARPTDTPVVADAEGVHVQGKCVPWPVITGFGTHRHSGPGPNSHLIATVLVDQDTADAWVDARHSAGGRRSRLYALGSVGADGIALPFNLAVNANQLSEALETIRADVTTRDRDGSNP